MSGCIAGFAVSSGLAPEGIAQEHPPGVSKWQAFDHNGLHGLPRRHVTPYRGM
jgi:hypothetical protein